MVRISEEPSSWYDLRLSSSKPTIETHVPDCKPYNLRLTQATKPVKQGFGEVHESQSDSFEQLARIERSRKAESSQALDELDGNDSFTTAEKPVRLLDLPREIRDLVYHWIWKSTP